MSEQRALEVIEPGMLSQLQDGGRIGHMAVGASTLQEAERRDVKGKAVLVMHTWRDALWELGAGRLADVPEPVSILQQQTQSETTANRDADEDGDEESVEGNDAGDASAEAASTSAAPESPAPEPTAVTHKPPPAAPSALTAEGASFLST